MLNLNFNAATVLSDLTATLILVAGVIADVRHLKFDHRQFIAVSLIAFLVSISVNGIQFAPFAVMGFIASFAVFLPFVLLKTVAAKEMKVLAAFGAVAGTSAVIWVAIASIIWGAFLGIIKVLRAGQGGILANNLAAIMTFKARKNLELHRVSFSLALFLAWLTYLIDARWA